MLYPVILHKNYTMNKLALLLVALMISSVLYAQGPGFPGDGETEDVPLDGGASLLAIGAAAYGAKRLKEYKANRNK